MIWLFCTQVRIASLPAGNSEWSENWVKNWSELWQPKSQKFELTAGSRYYLEALHHAKTPSKGMRVGVQIHNTWLDPHVVNSYYTERHEIRARALHLPEVQVSAASNCLGGARCEKKSVFPSCLHPPETAGEKSIVS